MPPDNPIPLHPLINMQPYLDPFFIQLHKALLIDPKPLQDHDLPLLDPDCLPDWVFCGMVEGGEFEGSRGFEIGLERGQVEGRVVAPDWELARGQARQRQVVAV